MSDQHSVTGKTIVLTGASSGFGRGAALQLAERGANVVIAARRGGVLDELVAEIAAAGGTAVAVETDVADPAAVARLAATAVADFGRFDVWINNAAVGAVGYFWDIPVEDHARVVDVALTGVIYGSHVALRQFRSQGEGVLLNIGSTDSEIPMSLHSSYAAAKAGVLSLGRTLNEELKLAGESERIKVGTLLPWAVDTPWWTHAANYTGHALRLAAMDDPQIVVDAIVEACTQPKEQQAIGPKARAATGSHHLFPQLTERLSAKANETETEKGTPVPFTTGALHRPMAEGVAVDGGVRERRKREDAARS